jgi:antitoxin ParD1/3/4/toxin ParE1/3/4
MSDYVVSPAAEQDILEIWLYLATQASIEFADQVESELFADFELLRRNPRIGHKREDLTNLPVLFYRAFPYPYMIIYQPKTPLGIVGVLHAKRNLNNLLQQRNQP